MQMRMIPRVIMGVLNRGLTRDKDVGNKRMKSRFKLEKFTHHRKGIVTNNAFEV